MLTANQLRQVAARSGARDIANVETDVILTHLLQLFHEKGLMDHLAFKGGTMLRKMVFGPRGRLSTDLDFTCRTDISLDDLMLMMLDALPDTEFLSANTLASSAPDLARKWKLVAGIQIGRVTHRIAVIPDAVFALHSKANGKTVYFFLEADRGKMPVDRTDLAQTSYRRKLHIYHLALKSGQHMKNFGFPNARVLTVTTTAERLQSMCRALNKIVREPTGRFLFADWASLAEANPLSHAWHTNTATTHIGIPPPGA
jgi:hypothetical protein